MEETVFTRLRSWRRTYAKELDVPPFYVLSNRYLAGVATALPTSMDELAACPGLGPKKLAQFGQDLVDLIRACLAEGLEPGVLPPAPAGAPPEPEATAPDRTMLSAEELSLIAAALRAEAVQRMLRRLKGRFTAAQVEAAVSHFTQHLPA